MVVGFRAKAREPFSFFSGRLAGAEGRDASAALATATRSAALGGFPFEHPGDPAVTGPAGRSCPGFYADLRHGRCLADDDRGSDFQFGDPFAKANHRPGIAEEERGLRRMEIRHT